MAATGKSADIGLDTQWVTMFFGEFLRGKWVDENLALRMRYPMLFKHAARLFLRATVSAYVERIVIATTVHVTLADPSIDQLFDFPHKIVRLSANLVGLFIVVRLRRPYRIMLVKIAGSLLLLVFLALVASARFIIAW